MIGGRVIYFFIKTSIIFNEIMFSSKTNHLLGHFRAFFYVFYCFLTLLLLTYELKINLSSSMNQNHINCRIDTLNKRYVIINDLDLKKSNLRNLLQLYAYNSIMEDQNCTKIPTGNLEYMLYQTMKPFIFDNLYTFL